MVTYIYKCPNCNKPLTYKEQLEYSKIQKRLCKKYCLMTRLKNDFL